MSQPMRSPQSLIVRQPTAQETDNKPQKVKDWMDALFQEARELGKTYIYHGYEYIAPTELPLVRAAVAQAKRAQVNKNGGKPKLSIVR